MYVLWVSVLIVLNSFVVVPAVSSSWPTSYPQTMPCSMQKRLEHPKDNDLNRAGEEKLRGQLQSELQTVRSQISLYGNQHNGKYPNLHRQGWRQLLEQTDLEGGSLEQGETAYGPYLRRAPINAINQSSSVCTTGFIDPDAGWTYDQRTGAMFAVVSDIDAARYGLDTRNDVRTYDAALWALTEELRSDLAVIRNGIDLYAIEHGGQYPCCDDIGEQLTLYTNLHGEVSGEKTSTYIYGPYLRRVPKQSLTQSDQFSPLDEPDTYQYAAWAYDERTGEFCVIVERDTPEHEALRRAIGEDNIAVYQQVEDNLASEQVSD